jgi:hypothetical protein
MCKGKSDVQGYIGGSDEECGGKYGEGLGGGELAVRLRME